MGAADQKPFDIERFRDDLGKAVKARGYTMKALATETGVSASTLSRMKTGRRPDAASMAALCAWAGINHQRYLTVKPRPAGLRVQWSEADIRRIVREAVREELDARAAGALAADPGREAVTVSPSPRAAAAEPRLIRTDHGFRFGAATVQALCTLPRGVTVVRILGGACAIEVHTTKTGRMRVYCNGLEVLCTKK